MQRPAGNAREPVLVGGERGQLTVVARVELEGNAGNRQTPCCTEYRLVDDAGTWSLRRRYDSTFPRYVLLGVNWEIP